MPQDEIARVGLDPRGYVKGAAKIKSTTKSVTGSFSKLGSAARNVGGLIATYFGARAIGSALQAYAVQEQAVAKLENALRAMGRAVPTKELTDFASQLQREGVFGDEVIIEAQALLATYREISDEAMPEATRVAVDLAAQFGISMRSAAKVVGQAALGMTGELSRYGISLSEEAKKSKDFGLIIRDIKTQVDGANKALAATATGALKQFGNTVGDINEEFGEKLAPSIVNLTQSLVKNRDAIVGALTAIASVIGLVAEGYAAAAGWAKEFYDWVRKAMGIKPEGSLQDQLAVVEGKIAELESEKPSRSRGPDVIFNELVTLRGEAAILRKQLENAEKAGVLQKKKAEIAKAKRAEADAAKARVDSGEYGGLLDEPGLELASVAGETAAGLGKDRSGSGSALYDRERDMRAGQQGVPNADELRERMEERLRLIEEEKAQQAALLGDASMAVGATPEQMEEWVALYEEYGLRMSDLRQAQSDKEIDLILKEMEQRKAAKEAEVANQMALRVLSDQMLAHRSKTLQKMGKILSVFQDENIQRILELIPAKQGEAIASGTAEASKAPWFIQPLVLASTLLGIASAFSSIKNFADGGFVPGGPPYNDRILAALTPGEYVVPRDQANEMRRGGTGIDYEKLGDVLVAKLEGARITAEIGDRAVEQLQTDFERDERSNL